MYCGRGSSRLVFSLTCAVVTPSVVLFIVKRTSFVLLSDSKYCCKYHMWLIVLTAVLFQNVCVISTVLFGYFLCIGGSYDVKFKVFFHWYM